MFSGYGAPEVVPRVRIMVQLKQNLEASDRRLTIGSLELLMDARRQQKRSHGVDQPAAPELIRVTGCHADHIEKWREETAAHQTMMRSRFVKIVGSGDWHDGFQVRRPLHRGLHLRSGKITDAEHAHIPVRPRLLPCPLHQIVHIAAFLTVKKAESAAGTASASAVRDDVHITSRHEEVAGACFDKTCRRTKVLNLSRIRRSGDQYGVPAGLS